MESWRKPRKANDNLGKAKENLRTANKNLGKAHEKVEKADGNLGANETLG